VLTLVFHTNQGALKDNLGIKLIALDMLETVKYYLNYTLSFVYPFYHPLFRTCKTDLQWCPNTLKLFGESLTLP